MQKGLAMGQGQGWILQCSIVCLVMVVHITCNRLCHITGKKGARQGHLNVHS